jgi:hypothetical protein
MISPEKSNKRIFRFILVVFVVVAAFAAWLVINATIRLK